MASDGPPTIPRDDPRRMRELLSRASRLAGEHALTSVVVGLAAPDGDLRFPEIVDYVESELRVDDAIFRMTRERAVLLLADVDRDTAEEIVRRNLFGFQERFPAASESPVALGFFEVRPGRAHLSVKEVLPALFAGAPEAA